MRDLSIDNPWAKAAPRHQPARLDSLTRQTALTLFALLLLGRSLQGAEREHWLSGVELQKQLRQPVSASWSRDPLATLLRNLALSQHVCIVLDRRVDPGFPLDLSVEEEPLAETLRRIADERNLGVSVLDSVVYVGPAPVAAQLRTISALKHEDLKGLPPARLRALQERKDWHWEDLATPRDLLAELAQQKSLQVEGAEQMPHDLWRGYELPPLAWTDRLLLLLVQFDLDFQLSADGKTLTVIPLAAHARISRSYPAHGQATELADKWRRQLPEADVTTKGDRVVVLARVEDHERIDPSQPASTGKTANTGKPIKNKAGKQVFQLAVDKTPVRQLLAQLGPKLGLTFEFDEEVLRKAGRSLDDLVSFSVREASLDELLTAALTPAGLKFERHERRVSISPEAKAGSN
jgi:hypothetical protein